MMKRGFDILASAAGLAVLAPVFLAVAVVIRLQSPGPVFYRQVRIGRNFKPFRIWKFRTMVLGADRSGTAVTLRNDPRVTPCGEWLRRLKLDELPQLLNIVAGQMSFVGPRPEVPRYVERFRPQYETILRVRPGITDLASLRFRHEADLLASAADAEQVYCDTILPEKLRLARQYLERASFTYDLMLIVRTIRAALRPTPGRQSPL